MPTPTFDGDNLLIILNTSEPLYDVQVDLYSDWKEWFKTSDNSKYHEAFRTAGGDDTEPGQFTGRNFFLRNDLGWRIRPAEEDAEILFEGNLFLQDSSLPWHVPTLGAFTVTMDRKFSNLSYVEEVQVAASDAAAQIASLIGREEERSSETIRSRPPGRRTT